jgi:hypothetical protein
MPFRHQASLSIIARKRLRQFVMRAQSFPPSFRGDAQAAGPESISTGYGYGFHACALRRILE